MPMRASAVRILFLADTHLGFDLPRHPRVVRRRRGHDFLENYRQALVPALHGEVDLIVHGGDLFYRSKVPAAVVDMALEPLVEAAQVGVPVYIVPGNHECSKIPLHLLTAHPQLNIFDEEKTYLLRVGNIDVGLSGFPFTRGIRDTFPGILRTFRDQAALADVRLLCMHQTVEGAQVGPTNFTFRAGCDVIRAKDIPAEFAAVLAGHIHRSQILEHDLAGNRLATPVLYAGAIERTSFAERYEKKHCVRLEIAASGRPGGAIKRVSFQELSVRPMKTLRLNLEEIEAEAIDDFLRKEIEPIDPDAIVRVQLHGDISADILKHVCSENLRKIAPPSMNISLDRRLQIRHQPR